MPYAPSPRPHVYHMTNAKSIRNVFISLFVVVWIIVFHYESLRAFYLEPMFKRSLPQIKFLFPPAGWIMFYKVEDGGGNVEVYGVKGNNPPQLIDSHQIFATRQIGYDNIHRGAMFAFVSENNRRQACRFLHRKFPYFQQFLVTYVEYPAPSKNPMEQNRYVAYQCE
jgi:hypothetical protein